MEQHSARVLRLLLQMEPQLLNNKGAAARMLVELADVAGAIAALILLENGEETLQELLFDISRMIDESAHVVAGLHLDDRGCAFN